MTQQLIDNLKEIVGEEFVKENENMAKHCTFKCGGNAALYVIPGSIDELVDTVKACRAENAPYMVIGNGSNILVRDEGYDGIIIEVNSRINTIDVIGEEIVADAGAKLSAIAMTAAVNDLGGFEFAHGIPGNVGGAVVMNAGAYGGEMKDVIKWVKVLDKDGNVRKLDISELDMGYRTSRIAKEGMIVLQMCIGLFIGTSEEISLIMQMLMQKRKAKQPLEFPSAGSTFKRPEGAYAAALIEECGLKGRSVGGAQVSEKHSGFVINRKDATCRDVLDLIKIVQQTVKEKTGFTLECEVRKIGFEAEEGK